ncbi:MULTISPECIES: Rrf2 family transcriptional regulator [Cupriavidus]|uniref:Transcriptional regulator n=1 Tax=Cupriavidus oxalaticus TaxID=96344 RepID=A0A4P7L3H9_9BURK|nr:MULTISPECIES: Rrf2 family transcriptional regulator [Cupriavidus]MBF6987829.1 Rrf2 family transcriptional regulator [Cupriavidus sp. IK-TO18]QBY49934.1 transcriptional regulator [Cupriavidus oxalaticus]TDF65584.1 transcriptional regulator [Cupriavidus sp. L7L]
MPDHDIDPAILAALQVLNQAPRDAATAPWSLAKIAKRAQLPMSVLRRVLTQLQSAGLADFAIDEAGHGHASLTQAGAELAAQAFPQND